MNFSILIFIKGIHLIKNLRPLLIWFKIPLQSRYVLLSPPPPPHHDPL
jgi:hypothetical protein